MKASASKLASLSIRDRVYSIYAPHMPEQHKERFLAILDSASSGAPNVKWLMWALDQLDALIDPFHPLAKDARKARGAIRLACVEVLAKRMRERLRESVEEGGP